VPPTGSARVQKVKKVQWENHDLPQQPYYPLVSLEKEPFCVNGADRIAGAEYLGEKDIP
jgi:hypothetical protein